MKKILNVFIIMLIVALSLPMFVSAEVKEFDFSKTKKGTLEEALVEEEISYDFTHKDNEKQVTIYLFRGHGCGYCHKFLEYASTTLMKNYGDKVKIVSYEVWNHQGNAELFQEVANFLEQDAGGVPFIIIGKKTFPGYAESMNSEIEAAINEEYAAKEKYDVIKEIKKSYEEAKRKEFQEKYGTVLLNGLLTLIIVGVATYINIRFVNKRFDELSTSKKVRYEAVKEEKKVVNEEKEEAKEAPVKKTTKKTTKKKKK